MNAVFMQKKSYDNTTWKAWEADQLVRAYNPNAERCGIKDDLLAYRNVTNTVPTSDRWGELEKAKTPQVEQENVV